MPSCGSKPVFISANCVSTMAAAQGSSRAMAISGRSTELASLATVAYLSSPMTSASVCDAGSVPFGGDELHGFERIQIVEIHFHDDGVGGAVGQLELRRKLRVILRQSMHRAGEVHGVALRP